MSFFKNFAAIVTVHSKTLRNAYRLGDLPKFEVDDDIDYFISFSQNGDDVLRFYTVDDGVFDSEASYASEWNRNDGSSTKASDGVYSMAYDPENRLYVGNVTSKVKRGKLFVSATHRTVFVPEKDNSIIRTGSDSYFDQRVGSYVAVSAATPNWELGFFFEAFVLDYSQDEDASDRFIIEHDEKLSRKLLGHRVLDIAFPSDSPDYALLVSVSQRDNQYLHKVSFDCVKRLFSYISSVKNQDYPVLSDIGDYRASTGRIAGIKFVSTPEGVMLVWLYERFYIVVIPEERVMDTNIWWEEDKYKQEGLINTCWHMKDSTVTGVNGKPRVSVAASSENPPCRGSQPYICYCEKSKGTEYIGTMRYTESDGTCLHWAEAVLYRDQEKNYCRNPGGVREKPWCYTSPEGAWEYCKVVPCECKEGDMEKCTCPHAGGLDYRGTISKSETGKECLKWAESLYYAGRVELRKMYDLSENYCRNPQLSGKQAWCYVSGETKYEYCNIPVCGRCRYDSCECDEECAKAKGYLYKGGLNRTKNGQKCLNWDSNPQYRMLLGNDVGLEKNFCRNPHISQQLDGLIPMNLVPESIFCLVKEDVAQGKNPTIKTSYELCDASLIADSDFGTAPTTTTTSTSDSTTTTVTTVDNHICGSRKVKQIDYIGSVGVSSNGLQCQAWASQTPRSHPHIPQDNETYLLANYCRNADKHSPLVWCYVMENEWDVKWDWCDVPMCEDL